MKVGFISLGCSKNLVDTEMMIGLFKKEKYEIVSDAKDADVIVVNTCGFIQSAKEEAINTLLEMAKYKEGNCKILIATGCLVERYKEELEKELPEVDIYLKFKDYMQAGEDSYKVFNKLFEDLSDRLNIENENKIKDNKELKLEFNNRVYTTGDNYAYLRIAEGCNNRCTYCAIPYIRGNYISRSMEDIIEEAKIIAASGKKELILIAQDTAKYGLDLYKERKLAGLLKELVKIDGIEWIRFLYTYPEDIDDELIEVVKNNPKICKYFDIPIQHSSNEILRMMARKVRKDDIEKTINKLRDNIPDVTIRTTVMCGFPGETEEDFKDLYEFVKKYEFDKLGGFAYSKEDGTPASRFENQVDAKTKKRRLNEILSLQEKIMEKKQREKIGKVINVLVEDYTEDGEYLIGRSEGDCPDIDSLAFIKIDERENPVGVIIKAKVVDVKNNDLICEKV